LLVPFGHMRIRLTFRWNSGFYFFHFVTAQVSPWIYQLWWGWIPYTP